MIIKIQIISSFVGEKIKYSHFFTQKHLIAAFILFRIKTTVKKYSVYRFTPIYLLIFFLLFGNSGNIWGETASATYTAGDISTDYSFRTATDNSSCPGTLTVIIPTGAIITGVDVSYKMISRNLGYMSEQRSQLRCVSTGGISESSVYSGSGNVGTYSYSRTGLTIANNVSGGGNITFELHAGRAWGGSGCSTYYNYVQNSSWTVTVNYYIPSGLTVTPTSLTGFTYAEDIGPSATQTFTASGASLTGNVTLTVDNSYYEISTNASSGFGSSLTLTPSGGTLVSTTIYVRLKAGLSVGTYNSQTITISSSGFTNKTVTCSGSVTTNSIVNDVFWFKADAGTSTTTNGSAVTSWTDQSSTGNNGTSQSTAPTYTSVLWNFNPSVNFSAGYYLINRGALQDDMTFYTLYNSTQTTSSTNWWTMPAIIGNEATNTVADFGLGQSGGKLYIKGTSGDNALLTSATYNNGLPQVVSGTRKKTSSSGNNLFIFVNGNQAAAGASDNVSLINYGNVGIGRNPTESSSQFEGGISEVIGKSYLATTTERWVFESYLAIKYGVTLSNDYKKLSSSSDSLIYSITGYNFDIAGLGRNNILGLNQKVSSSSNVTSGSARVVMATDNDFTSSNLSTSRTSLTNGQYLIWGHNNGTVGTWTAIASTSYSRVNRIWRVQNTSNVGTVNFQIDLTNFATLPSAEYCYVLIIGNSTFSNINSIYPLANTSGNLYTAQPIFPSGTYYFTVARVPNYWIGRNSTDWGTASNWTANFIPATGQNVVYATTTNYGTVAQNDLILDQDRTVGNFTNATTKQLIIPVGKALIINGTATTSSNPDLIQILANATQPNGSLIFANPQLNTNVQATIQMYSKGCRVPTTTWTGGDGIVYTTSYAWQYFGLPVQSATASPTFDGSWVREYSESKNGPTYYQKWTQLANSNTLSPFKGYEITQENAKTNVIQGKLVVSDATLNLTKSSGYGAGYNIFGNSYTAAIDISKINFPSSGVDKTVYLYNTASLSQWGGGSTYTAIPYNAAQIIGNEIPSMQGYLLIASAPCTVTIPYNATVSSLTKNTMPQKVKSIQKAKTEQTGKESSTLPYIKIEVNNDSTYDCAWIFDINGTSHDYDNGWDGYKLTGTQGTLIYSDEVSGKMQVNTLDNIDSVYLDFKANDRTNIHYTLNINSENIIEMYNDLYFKDLKTGASIKFDSKSITYHFTADNADEAEKRFLIGGVKKYSDGSNPFVVSQNYGRKIMIKNNGYENGKIYLYDTVGKTIAVCDCPAQDTVSIPYQLQQGIYITKIETQKGRKFTQKIVIK